jgi:TatD DNase family protein
MIDTHCHYNHPQMNLHEGDAEQSIARASAAGVTGFIVVGYDLESSRRAVEIAETHPNFGAAVGMHPHGAQQYTEEFDLCLQEWAHNPVVVAIGEIGLDYYRNISPADDQTRVFARQLDIASNAKLPVIIHCRDAYADALSLLDRESVKAFGGVMHCWAGSPEQALQTVTLGMHLGFGGTTTYAKAQNVHESAAAIPLSRILLETDCPYLSPVPHRGKRNEPAYIKLVANRVADLRGISAEELIEEADVNSRQCFPRLAPLLKGN